MDVYPPVVKKVHKEKLALNNKEQAFGWGTQLKLCSLN